MAVLIDLFFLVLAWSLSCIMCRALLTGKNVEEFFFDGSFSSDPDPIICVAVNILAWAVLVLPIFILVAFVINFAR